MPPHRRGHASPLRTCAEPPMATVTSFANLPFPPATQKFDVPPREDFQEYHQHSCYTIATRTLIFRRLIEYCVPAYELSACTATQFVIVVDAGGMTRRQRIMSTSKRATRIIRINRGKLWHKQINHLASCYANCSSCGKRIFRPLSTHLFVVPATCGHIRVGAHGEAGKHDHFRMQHSLITIPTFRYPQTRRAVYRD